MAGENLKQIAEGTGYKVMKPEELKLNNSYQGQYVDPLVAYAQLYARNRDLRNIIILYGWHQDKYNASPAANRRKNE